MATEVGKIFVTLELATKAFDRAAERARRTAQGLGASLSSALNRASGPSMALGAALGGVAASIGGVAVKAVSLAGGLEQTRMAFTTMLGDAKRADAFIRDMYEFAARTPFEVNGLFEASRMMLAFGFAAEDIKPTLTAIGNAVSALGGSQELISRVTLALGQMSAKGRVSGEEMRQLAEAGIPAWRYLAAAIGTDLPAAMKMAENGAIRADTAIRAIVEGMNKDFAGMMDKQSRTLLGLWSTAKDTVSQALTSIGDKLVETFDLKGKLSKAISVIQALAERFRSFLGDLSKLGLTATIEKWFGKGARQKLLAIAGAVVGALVPAFTALAASVGSAVAALAPFAAAGALVALAVAKFGPKLIEAAGGFEGLRAMAARVASSVSSLAPAFGRLASSARGMATAVVRAIAPALRYVASGFASLAPYVGPALRNVLALVSAIVSRIAAVIRAMTPVVAAALRAITPIVKGALGAVFAIIRAALALIAGDWRGAWAALADAVRSLFVPVRAVVEAVVSAIKRAIERLMAPIRSLGSIASRLLGVGGTGHSRRQSRSAARGGATPFASGGIVARPTVALVGERGPEAVIPLSRLPSLLAQAARPQAVEVVIRPTGGAERFVEAVVRRAAARDARR